MADILAARQLKADTNLPTQQLLLLILKSLKLIKAIRYIRAFGEMPKPENTRSSLDAQTDNHPPRCHLLQLPPKILRRIYLNAGLGPNRSLDMNFCGVFRNKKSVKLLHSIIYSTREADVVEIQGIKWGSERVNLEAPPLPISLLYVCKSMHAQVEKLLYSENRLIATRRDPGGLDPLERISPSAIRAVTQLTIRVNLASCVMGCCNEPQRCGNTIINPDWKHDHDPPLRNVSKLDKDIISQWQRICARLAQNIMPNQLALYVICDCHDQKVAEMIIDPLLSMPCLRDCALRLGVNYNEQLQNLAEVTTLRLMGRFVPPTGLPFRFLDMPKEIQYEILSYTSLVPTHRHDVITCSEGSVMGQVPLFLLCGNHGEAISHISHPLSFKYASYSEYGGLRLDGCTPRCFCTKAHSAFTFKCTCENEAFEYLTVSREFRQAVTHVFYGSYVFSIGSDGFVPLYQAGTSQELLERAMEDTLPLTRWIPVDCFQYLRHLQLNFDSLETNHGLLSTLGWKQWLNTINLLRRHLNLPILTLEIRMRESFWYGSWSVEQARYLPPQDLGRVKEEQEARMHNMYLKLFGSLKVLEGIKDLFIYMNYEIRDGDADDDGRWEQERILENLIMGSGYDSRKRGKKTPLELNNMH